MSLSGKRSIEMEINLIALEGCPKAKAIQMLLDLKNKQYNTTIVANVSEVPLELSTHSELPILSVGGEVTVGYDPLELSRLIR